MDVFPLTEEKFTIDRMRLGEQEEKKETNIVFSLPKRINSLVRCKSFGYVR